MRSVQEAAVSPSTSGRPDDELPLQRGSRGESVRDVRRRLEALGFPSSGDEPGYFGTWTERAVVVFQRDRGLRSDGVCGRQTWGALVEAGRVLGERLLYYRQPMLRGDDIAALQAQLGALGFDAGRVDGIFGPLAQEALRDFQRNSGLVDDGILGPETLNTLLRVGSKTNGQDVVAAIRERQRLRESPRTLPGRRVVVGETGGLAALADSAKRALTRAGAIVTTIHDPEGSGQASQANALDGEVYIGLGLDPERVGCTTAYFLGYNGVSSEGGRRLAEALQLALPRRLGIPDHGTQGMRLPVLRETRMPAVLIEVGPSAVVVERAADLAAAVAEALGQWVSAPCDDQPEE
jgi:N-acetylmuramoyl-L-alanine amidase